MPRGRQIKPGYFLDGDLLECDPLARILFAGLWCWADREGRLEDKPKDLKVQILPADNVDVNDLLDQLSPHFVTRYEIGGKRYIQINNFDSHQNPHKNETPSTIPPPDDSLHLREGYSASTVQAPEKNTTNPACVLVSLDPCIPVVDDMRAGADDNDDLPAEMRDPGLAAVNNAMIKATGSCPNGLQQEDVKACIDELGAELVLHAVTTSADNAKGGFGWKYVKSTLEAWKRQGLKTPELVDAHEKRRDEAKARSGTQREPPEKIRDEDRPPPPEGKMWSNGVLCDDPVYARQKHEERQRLARGEDGDGRKDTPTQPGG